MDRWVIIVGDSDAPVWGSTGAERLRRYVARFGNARTVPGPEEVPPDARVVLMRGDHLYDPRLLRALLSEDEDLVLQRSSGAPPLAACVNGAAARAVMEALAGRGGPGIESLAARVPGDLVPAYDEKLRRKNPPYLVPITRGNLPALEHALFDSTYKGVTDFVTKWWWPRPAEWVTHLCVKLRLLPNHVTLLGLALAILAGWAFWVGQFGIGLVCGWLMTFLDTVDGKLARVTLTWSRFGDVLDHGIDLVHPPLWYLAWGIGLAAVGDPVADLETLMWILLGAYVGGRLCEGAFYPVLASFSMFVWRRFDSWNRLFTARRNPNLVLLTVAWIAGAPALGLLLVAGWHVVSTLVLLARVVSAALARMRSENLHAWLEDIDPVTDRDQLSVRVFTGTPFHSAIGSPGE